MATTLKLDAWWRYVWQLELLHVAHTPAQHLPHTHARTHFTCMLMKRLDPVHTHTQTHTQSKIMEPIAIWPGLILYQAQHGLSINCCIYIYNMEHPNFFACFILFIQLYRLNGISPTGNMGYLSWGKPAATRVTLPSLLAGCFSVSIIHWTPTWTTGSLTCADINACDCAWGFMDAVTESALKVDSGRKIPCCTRESDLRRQHASPMLYQLRYICRQI